MKNIILLLLLATAAYKGWGYLNQQTVEPLHSDPYLIVYGRDSCGFTQQTVKELQRAGIRYQYENIDDPAVANPLHSRMNAMGINTRRYMLPVVDLNNSISTRPDNDELVQKARDLSL